MFTVKLYSSGNFRTRILECESLTVLDGPAIGSYEVTLHQRDGKDVRYDIKEEYACSAGAPIGPGVFAKAIIENSAGKTTSIYALVPRSGVMAGAGFIGGEIKGGQGVRLG